MSMSLNLALKAAHLHAALGRPEPALLHITPRHSQPPPDSSRLSISASYLLDDIFSKIVLNNTGNFGDTLIHKVLLIFSLPKSGAF